MVSCFLPFHFIFVFFYYDDTYPFPESVTFLNTRSEPTLVTCITNWTFFFFSLNVIFWADYRLSLGLSPLWDFRSVWPDHARQVWSVLVVIIISGGERNLGPEADVCYALEPPHLFAPSWFRQVLPNVGLTDVWCQYCTCEWWVLSSFLQYPDDAWNYIQAYVRTIYEGQICSSEGHLSPYHAKNSLLTRSLGPYS